MAIEHMKNGDIVIIEIQVRAATGYRFTHFRMVPCFVKEITSVGGDAEKSEPSYTLGGIETGQPVWKRVQGFLKR